MEKRETENGAFLRLCSKEPIEINDYHWTLSITRLCFQSYIPFFVVLDCFCTLWSSFPVHIPPFFSFSRSLGQTKAARFFFLFFFSSEFLAAIGSSLFSFFFLYFSFFFRTTSKFLVTKATTSAASNIYAIVNCVFSFFSSFFSLISPSVGAFLVFSFQL